MQTIITIVVIFCIGIGISIAFASSKKKTCTRCGLDFDKRSMTFFKDIAWMCVPCAEVADTYWDKQ